MLIADLISNQQVSALKSAVDYFGSQQAMATALGVSRQQVNAWIKRGYISASKAIEVEKLTDGSIKKRELRPEIAKWIDEK